MLLEGPQKMSHVGYHKYCERILDATNFNPLVSLFLLDHIAIGSDLIPLEELRLLFY